METGDGNSKGPAVQVPRWDLTFNQVESSFSGRERATVGCLVANTTEVNFKAKLVETEIFYSCREQNFIVDMTLTITFT